MAIRRDHGRPHRGSHCLERAVVLSGVEIIMKAITSWARLGVLCGALLGSFGGPAQAVDTTQLGWMLAAPEGGCTDLSVIRPKTRDLGAWNSPEELVDTLRARDENVSTLTANVDSGYVLKLVVPGRDIDVVFVPFSVCRAMWQEKIQRSAP